MRLDPQKRRAMTAIYAFCRWMDDLVDEPQHAEHAKQSLQQWKSQLQELSAQDNPIAEELHWVTQNFPLQLDDLAWLIDGVSMDLSFTPYATWDDLYAYCDAVASSVGKMCMDIFGVDRNQSHEYAIATGRALQLTNIARDVFFDVRLDRVYIPLEAQKKCGVSPQDFYQKKWNAQVACVMEELLGRAKDYYDLSDQLEVELDAKSIWPARVMKDIYREIYRRIEKKPAKIAKEKVTVPKLKQLWISQSVYQRLA